MLLCVAMGLQFCLWEERRYREGTSAWVLTVQEGKKRGARLTSCPSKGELEHLSVFNMGCSQCLDKVFGCPERDPNEIQE